MMRSITINCRCDMSMRRSSFPLKEIQVCHVIKAAMPATTTQPMRAVGIPFTEPILVSTLTLSAGAK